MAPPDIEGMLEEDPPDSGSVDMQLARRTLDLNRARSKVKRLIGRVKDLEDELGIRDQLGLPIDAPPIKARTKKSGEATAIAMLSDVHWGEVVDPRTINGMNEYTPEIAERAVRLFFQGIRDHIETQRAGVRIRDLILVLGGDLITGSIHDELQEVNALGPIPEAIEVQAAIKTGIRFLLDDRQLRIRVACVYGNHGRITKKRRHATGARHNIERLIYENLRVQFEDTKRVHWTVANGAHIYQQVYDNGIIRITHGDDCKFFGGAAGLSLPLHKAVKAWNTVRYADLTILGHFHQLKDFGHSIVNGSTIGFNAYALAIKAEFEPPRQAFFLWDKTHGKTIFAPIIVR